MATFEALSDDDLEKHGQQKIVVHEAMRRLAQLSIKLDKYELLTKTDIEAAQAEVLAILGKLLANQ